MNQSERLPSLKSLRAFQVAGRHMSFKLAAEELYLSPSAVSHQVRNLEDFLGMPLFVRRTRALEFTQAGLNYFEFLDRMFASLETETRQLKTRFGRRVVRLCAPPFFASQALLPRLSSWQAISPTTDIELSTQPSLVKEHSGDTDVSVLLGRGVREDLVIHKLFPRRLVTACTPSVKTNLDSESYSSLDGQTLIVHQKRPEAWMDWAKALGIRPPRAGNVIRFDSMTDVVQGTVQGLGIALVSWPLSERWFKEGQLVRVFSEEVTTEEFFYLAHRPDENTTEHVGQLLEWMLSEFGPDR